MTVQHVEFTLISSMLQLQLFMLFGFVAIFSLSVSAVQHGDVHLSCERFKEGRLSHCNCTINKTEADSEKCSRSHPVQTVAIEKTGDGVSTILCHFSNYTTGTLHRSHSRVNCSLHSIIRNEVYILKFETIANRSRDEGAQINCTVSCVNANYDYGLTTSSEGVPIQFENTRDTSTAPVNATGTAVTSENTRDTSKPENTGDTSTISGVVIAVVVITVLAHLAVCILLIVDGVKCEWVFVKDGSRFRDKVAGRVTAVVLYALYFPGLVYIVIAAVKNQWPFDICVNGRWRRTLFVLCMIVPECMVVYLICAAIFDKWPFRKEKSGQENSNDVPEFSYIPSSPDKQKKTSKKVDSEHTNSYNRV